MFVHFVLVFVHRFKHIKLRINSQYRGDGEVFFVFAAHAQRHVFTFQALTHKRTLPQHSPPLLSLSGIMWAMDYLLGLNLKSAFDPLLFSLCLLASQFKTNKQKVLESKVKHYFSYYSPPLNIPTLEIMYSWDNKTKTHKKKPTLNKKEKSVFHLTVSVFLQWRYPSSRPLLLILCNGSENCYVRPEGWK